MARNNDRERSTTKRAPKENIRKMRKKVCIFCRENIVTIDYKEVNLLKKFISDRGKIRSRRVSGNCTQHQRDVAGAIKLSRELALLPYTQRTTNERSSGKPNRHDGDRDKWSEVDDENTQEEIEEFLMSMEKGSELPEIEKVEE
jgi:small subunit ribosomal protein S18